MKNLNLHTLYSLSKINANTDQRLHGHANMYARLAASSMVEVVLRQQTMCKGKSRH